MSYIFVINKVSRLIYMHLGVNFLPEFRMQGVEAATSITGNAGGLIASPNTFTYPLNVGEYEEQPHSVIFFINARESTRAGNRSVQMKADYDSFEDVFSNSTSLNPVTAEQAERQRVGNNLNKIGGLIINFASGALGLKAGGKTIAGKVIGGGLGVIAGQAFQSAGAGKSLGLNAGVNRMMSAIELHVAQPPIAQYSAEWDNSDTGIVGGLISSGEKLPSFDEIMEDPKTAFGGLGGQTIRGVARGAIQGAARITDSIGLTGDLAGSIDAASGNTLNPNKEQLFRSMGFRKFAFSYKFAPRNRTEYENVMAIIHLFKYHMHPEKDVANMTLVYPSEFDIEFKYRGKRNENLSKISSCVLTDVKVTYGNQDSFNTIKNEGGAPAEINMEIAFAETDMMIRSEDGTGISEHWRDSH